MNAENYLTSYYENGGRKLHDMVDRILRKYGGLSGMDIDDFYSAANQVMADICRTYNEQQAFDQYVYLCLSNKIKSEMTRRNREKRKADRTAVSLYAPVGRNSGLTIADSLASDFDMEAEVFGKGSFLSGKLEQYLSNLSKVQRRIVELLAGFYKPAEIQETLHLTGKEYVDHLRAIRAYENVRLLL